MGKFMFLLALLLTSCVTYKRSVVIGEFKDESDPWEVKTYQIHEVSVYERKTKKLISRDVDTVRCDPEYLSRTLIKN